LSTGQHGAGSGPVPTVSVVIPTLNEADNLPYVLPALPNWVSQVVIVDGGSTDGTVEVALQLRPDVEIILQSGRGKGDALATGFGACTSDIIVAMDADGSTDVAELPAFVEALTEGAAYVKGSRYLPGGGSADLSSLRSVGNRVLTLIVNLLYKTSYTDLCYGYTAFWARSLERLCVDCDGFEVETLMNIRAARAGLPVAEVPSFEQARVHGDSHLRTFRDGWRVLRVILCERVRRMPANQAPIHGVAEQSKAPVQ